MRSNAHLNKSKGAVVPIVVVMIVMLMTVSAVTLNLNWMLYHRINAQSTADLSALSALASIQTDANAATRITDSKELGRRLYELNYDRSDVGITQDEIRLGYLENTVSSNPSFVVSESNNSSISAVEVSAPSESHDDVPLFFGDFFGNSKNVTIVADSTVGTKTVDIMLCLDASRSMNRVSTSRQLPPGAKGIHEPPLPGSRWFELKATVASFLDSLRDLNPNARIGLVTFGGGLVRQHIKSDLDADWARLETKLTLAASDEANGINDLLESYARDHPALGLGTSIYDGLDFSIKELDNTDATRHIILLSDGEQVAPGRPDESVAAADAHAEGITIHSISFGGNFTALNAISNLTGGSNFTAFSESQLRDAFNQLLGSFRVQLVD